MDIFKRLITIWKLPDEVEALKRLSKVDQIENHKKEVLKCLKTKKTTKQVAKEIGMSRGWTSTIINALEKEGKVVEFEKKGRTIYYKKK